VRGTGHRTLPRLPVRFSSASTDGQDSGGALLMILITAIITTTQFLNQVGTMDCMVRGQGYNTYQRGCRERRDPPLRLRLSVDSGTMRGS